MYRKLIPWAWPTWILARSSMLSSMYDIRKHLSGKLWCCTQFLRPRYIKSDFGESFNKQLLESCVVDLIDPCNVIIYDSHSDSYTFGHFRYQEHLASEEISSNREVDILDLLFDDWWRGALCLYAQENDFCSLIENCYNKYGSVKRARITLDAMIKNTTKSKRPRHLEIFNNYSSLSDFEAGLYEDSYLDDWDDPNDLIR